MYYRKALCAQQENVDQGTLQITVHSKTDNRPVENALVRISYTGDPNSVIEEVRTDSSGNTPVLQLKTPPLEYSLNASEEAQPYAEYSMQIKAEDFHQEEIAVSCIGCGICEKTCTAGAIRVTDNCAVIEESVCLSCGMCAVKCPRHAIYDLRGIYTAKN